MELIQEYLATILPSAITNNKKQESYLRFSFDEQIIDITFIEGEINRNYVERFGSRVTETEIIATVLIEKEEAESLLIDAYAENKELNIKGNFKNISFDAIGIIESRDNAIFLAKTTPFMTTIAINIKGEFHYHQNNITALQETMI